MKHAPNLPSFNALGATVHVKAAGQIYTKYNDGKSGYLAQSALPLYFGLDAANKVDQIEIEWPSGRRQTVTSGLTVNQTIKIVEPK